MAIEPLQFPPLILSLEDTVDWPLPPSAWRQAAPLRDPVHPCKVETTSGTIVEGGMVGLDLTTGILTLRLQEGAPAVKVAFGNFRRLTLTTPLKAADDTFESFEPIPAAAQEREYRLEWADATHAPTVGRSAAYVEKAEGLFLFTPAGDERSVLRVFVPRAAYMTCTFGQSAEEVAISRWFSDPDKLLLAIKRQESMPVLPLGQSLLELGMITQAQLHNALATQPSHLPLGEWLVTSLVITRADLNTALAHKMGYPVVNLARFPIDPLAAKKVSLRVAISTRALPLMIDGRRLIVAVDKPSRTVKLRSMQVAAEMTLVPVLASKGNILAALQRLSEHGIWLENVSMAFFPTTN